jgi:hypothetical protein
MVGWAVVGSAESNKVQNFGSLLHAALMNMHLASWQEKHVIVVTIYKNEDCVLS